MGMVAVKEIFDLDGHLVVQVWGLGSLPEAE